MNVEKQIKSMKKKNTEKTRTISRSYSLLNIDSSGKVVYSKIDFNKIQNMSEGDFSSVIKKAIDVFHLTSDDEEMKNIFYLLRDVTLIKFPNIFENSITNEKLNDTNRSIINELNILLAELPPQQTVSVLLDKLETQSYCEWDSFRAITYLEKLDLCSELLKLYLTESIPNKDDHAHDSQTSQKIERDIEINDQLHAQLDTILNSIKNEWFIPMSEHFPPGDTFWLNAKMNQIAVCKDWLSTNDKNPDKRMYH